MVDSYNVLSILYYDTWLVIYAAYALRVLKMCVTTPSL